MLLFILTKQLKEETRYDLQMYTSLGPMMRMHTKTYPLMTIKSFTNDMINHCSSEIPVHIYYAGHIAVTPIFSEGLISKFFSNTLKIFIEIPYETSNVIR